MVEPVKVSWRTEIGLQLAPKDGEGLAEWGEGRASISRSKGSLQRAEASARGYQSDGPKSQDVGRAGRGPSTLLTGFHF